MAKTVRLRIMREKLGRQASGYISFRVHECGRIERLDRGRVIDVTESMRETPKTRDKLLAAAGYGPPT